MVQVCFVFFKDIAIYQYILYCSVGPGLNTAFTWFDQKQTSTNFSSGFSVKGSCQWMLDHLSRSCPHQMYFCKTLWETITTRYASSIQPWYWLMISNVVSAQLCLSACVILGTVCSLWLSGLCFVLATLQPLGLFKDSSWHSPLLLNMFSVFTFAENWGLVRYRKRK